MTGADLTVLAEILRCFRAMPGLCGPAKRGSRAASLYSRDCDPGDVRYIIWSLSDLHANADQCGATATYQVARITEDGGLAISRSEPISITTDGFPDNIRPGVWDYVFFAVHESISRTLSVGRYVEPIGIEDGRG